MISILYNVHFQKKIIQFIPSPKVLQVLRLKGFPNTAPPCRLSVKAPERPRGIGIPRIRPVEGWGGTGQVVGFRSWRCLENQLGTWNLDLELGFVIFFLTDFYQFVKWPFFGEVFFWNWLSKHRTSKSKTTILYMVGYQLDDFKFLYIEIWLESTISIHFTLVVMGPFQERTKSFRRLDGPGVWGFSSWWKVSRQKTVNFPAGWWNSRWWFQGFVVFSPTRSDDPIWLIFFKWVETTN